MALEGAMLSGTTREQTGGSRGRGAGAGVGVKQVKGAEAQTSSASQDIMSSTVATVSNATLCMLSLYKSSS